MNLKKMLEIKKRLNEWSNKNKLDIALQRQTYLTDMLDKIHKYYVNNGKYEQINSLCEMAILTLCVIEDRDINEELVENYEHSFILKINGVLEDLKSIAFYNQNNADYSCYLNEYHSILISVLNELDSLNMDYIKCLEEKIKEYETYSYNSISKQRELGAYTLSEAKQQARIYFADSDWIKLHTNDIKENEEYYIFRLTYDETIDYEYMPFLLKGDLEQYTNSEFKVKKWYFARLLNCELKD